MYSVQIARKQTVIGGQTKERVLTASIFSATGRPADLGSCPYRLLLMASP
jgi:hypothetical protein